MHAFAFSLYFCSVIKHIVIMSNKFIHILSCLIAFVWSMSMAAQSNDENAQRRQWNDAFMQHHIDSLPPADSLSLAGEKANDLSLPWNTPMVSLGGYGLGGYGALTGNDFSWRLHEGFNAQFGMSLTAGIGKHAPKGVGFGQSAAFAYVMPLTKRLSVAAGITATNFDWGSWRRTDVGIGGVLAYQVNDNISLYAYGQKTFLPRTTTWSQWRRDPFPTFLDIPRDRFGAAAEFKIGEKAVIGVSVERSSY